MTDKDKQDRQEQRAPTWLGWTARIVSLALLGALVAVIALQIARPTSPPSLSAKVVTEDIRQGQGQWLIPVEISNEGTQTARQVELSIDAGGETSEVGIAMIGESETVTFVLPAPGPVDTVTLKVKSYEAP